VSKERTDDDADEKERVVAKGTIGRATDADILLLKLLTHLIRHHWLLRLILIAHDSLATALLLILLTIFRSHHPWNPCSLFATSSN
jgi:hypothetical protein